MAFVILIGLFIAKTILLQKVALRFGYDLGFIQVVLTSMVIHYFFGGRSSVEGKDPLILAVGETVGLIITYFILVHYNYI